MKKQVIIFGNGSREVAILKSLIKEQVNGDIGSDVEFCYHADKYNPAIPCKYLGGFDIDLLIKANKHLVEYVVVGQEKYFQDPLILTCFMTGIPVVGPHPVVAKLETSKMFAREVVQQVDKSFNPSYHLTDLRHDMSFVIKPDGLSGGKGVKIYPDDFNSYSEAMHYIRELGGDNRCVIEERLEGDEFSLMCFTDGKILHFMPIVQDFKRGLEGDKGVNTGSMGSICDNRYAPFAMQTDMVKKNAGIYFLDSKEYARCTEFMNKVVGYMKAQVREYKGILYGSFMKTKDGQLKLIEFNCRFGDPEVINVLDLLMTPLHDIFNGIIQNTLHLIVPVYENKVNHVVYVVPEKYGTGEQVVNDENTLQLFNRNDIMDYESDDRIEFSHHMLYGHKHHNNEKKDKPYEIFPASVNKIGNVNPLKTQLYPTKSRFYGVLFTGKGFEECQEKLDTYFRQHIVPAGLRRRTDILNTYLDRKNRYHYTSLGGVDTNMVNKTLEEVKTDIQSTQVNQSNEYGSFGGHYTMKSDTNIELVASTDGVGTKILLLEQVFGDKGYYIAGQDLVNHNIDDILIDGAEPRFFLDYYGCNKFEPNNFKQFIKGCTDACKKYNIALVGGETAVMKDVYRPNTADLTGTIVGCKTMTYHNGGSIGQILVGIPSSGFHTNGFSLLRSFVDSDDSNTFLDSIKLGITEPHRCYLDLVSELYWSDETPIIGLVHITGGGFHDNIKRIVKRPYELDIDAFEFPVYYNEILKRMTKEECINTFNCGYGLVIITDGLDATNFENIKKLEPNAKIIGKIY